MSKKSLDSSQRNLTLASVAFVVAFGLWQIQGMSLITYPFRLFVTMIHELGHGLSAILTGGSFLRFEVSSRGAGLAYTRGGTRFLVIQAGYLGTALFGAGLLFFTHRVRKPQFLAIAVGVLIGTLTLLYTGISLYQLTLLEIALAAGVLAVSLWYVLTVDEHDPSRHYGLVGLATGAVLLLVFAGSGNLLTITVGLLSALVLVLLGLFAPPAVVVGILTFLAFLTGLQAITDAWILLRIVSLPSALMPNNDAVSMANEVGGPATLWALTWIAVDVVLFGATSYYTFIKPRRKMRLG